MNLPTAADIKTWSKLDWAAGGYSDVDITRFVARAAAILQRITGQVVATLADDDPIKPLIEQAIQGLAEQQSMQESAETMETLSDWDLIASFSAGPYSETRRSPQEAFQARLLNAWPWLSSLLWEILTDDKRAEWIQFFTGVNAPAWGVQEVGWQGPLDTVYWNSADGYIWGA